VLMFVGQEAKAQVLSCFSSLSRTNLFDTLFDWQLRLFVVMIMANLVGLLTLCGHILELVEAQIFLLGVLLSTLSGVILRNYFITKSIITHRATSGYEQKKNKLGWCNYYFICAIKTHYLMASSIITIEVVISP